MKIKEFKIGENIIEFHNSIIGQETVYLNEKKVSEKYSFFGTEHNFELNNKLFELNSSCQSFVGFGVNLELIENGKIIKRATVNSIEQTIAGIIIGIMIGLAFIIIMF